MRCVCGWVWSNESETDDTNKPTELFVRRATLQTSGVAFPPTNIHLSAPGPEIQTSDIPKLGEFPFSASHRGNLYMIQPAGFPSPSSSLGVFCCDFCSLCFCGFFTLVSGGRSAPAVTSGCRWRSPSEDPEDSRSPALLITPETAGVSCSLAGRDCEQQFQRANC